jgi:iron complex outermembrane receptor protein
MQSFLHVHRLVAAPRAARVWIFAGATLLVALGAPPSFAQPTLAALPQLKELAELELEQLARITVTSVTLREQRLADAPAALYVISAEDIRRSGVTTLPEALRLAPNLMVARADANQYAISARSFNNVLANKMLVLIDGRTVYSPLFSGVFWEAQQVLLEDVERIEVISGPGATLWGANAVNGVINVITRRAEETQGALVVAGGGNRKQGGAVRWGGAIGGDGYYRIYAQAGERRHTQLETGGDIADGSTSAQAGFRADWGGARSRLTVQGDAYRNDTEQQPGGSRDLGGANLVSHWTRTFDSGHYLNVQAYYDRVERDQPGAIRERLDTLDIEVHHGLQPTPSQRVLWGGGYRWMHDDLVNLSPTFALLPATRNLHRGNVFAQDEIALSPALALSLGLKLEHNGYTGWEVLPDARLAWRPAPDQMIWGAASRALRSPSRVDREFFVPANPPFAFAGGPDFQAEVAEVFELGYRAQPTAAASYSLSVFHHDFDRLKTTEPRPGGAVIENRMTGRLDGVNGWGSYRISPRWRMTAGFNWMRERRQLDPGSASIGGTAAAGNDPSSWFQVGAALDLAANLELDVRARRIGALPSGPVPAYTAVDARVGWKPAPRVEVSLSVQNLLDAGHPEWGGPANRAEFERSFFVKVLWRM